jgi:hypothetical protein
MRIETSRFRFRTFITLVVLLSFLGACASGIALYLRPEGSLARWIGWKFAGWDKRQWEAAHMGVVVLFMISSFIHIGYNFRPLVSYLRGRAALVLSSGSRWPLIVETAAALAILALVTLGAAGSWAPFSYVIQLRNSMKDAKFILVMPPPVVDADKLTVAGFCGAAGLEVQAALRHANGHGVVIENSTMVIGKIAQNQGISPEELCLVLRGD